MNVLVAGGAGMIGSELCEALLGRGDAVTCVDNLLTGRAANLCRAVCHERFSFLRADAADPGLDRLLPAAERFGLVYHLASPASPADFARYPVEIMRAGSEATRNLLELSRAHGARFVLASTSEIYGDPEVCPQPEDYCGRVNPVGPRSVYDEAKRFAEALSAAYGRHLRTSVGIARIFNTYGPRMRHDDGRVISTFLRQAAAGEPLTVHGDGRQTRSFCHVDDLVAGLVALGDRPVTGPVNLGNPEEVTVNDLAALVCRLAGRPLDVEHLPPLADEPRRRCPDISTARSALGWSPRIPLEAGLRRCLEDRRDHTRALDVLARARSLSTW